MKTVENSLLCISIVECDGRAFGGEFSGHEAGQPLKTVYFVLVSLKVMVGHLGENFPDMRLENL